MQKTNVSITSALVPGTPQQEEIWKFILHGTEHGLIDSRAGSGKTFTIVQGALRLPKDLRVGVFGFNSHIIREINQQFRERRIYWVRGSTYHSFGFAAIRNVFPGVKLVQDKLDSIIRTHIVRGSNYHDRARYAALRKLVQLCKNVLNDGMNHGVLADLVSRHSIELPFDSAEEVFDLVPQVLRECLDWRASVDFDDQIWVPARLRLPVEQFDLILIDEAQDTNSCQQELALMACPGGRIVIVGDRFQSSYGFRGADADAIPSLYQRLKNTERGCMVLPLTVTRRCPKLHVALAQGLVPDLEALHDAPEGEILQVGNEEAVRMMGPTDMVICRVNRYLVPAAYALIKRGIKAVIRGRDIGKNLVALIDSLHAADIYDLHRRIADYEYRETPNLEALGDKGAPLLEELKDRVGCVIALCEGVTTITELKSRIDSLFVDVTDDGQRRDYVLLGTIHRTKGLEANNVFILAPELIPHPLAKQPWEREQERNLAYIAATRSKFEGDEPGRLIFVGSIPDIYGFAEDLPSQGSRAGAACFQPSNSGSAAEGWPY